MLANSEEYESMDSSDLVKYLRQNPRDERAWEAFLKRYHRLIWSFIPRGYSDSEALYQDIQLAIWDGILNRYKGEGVVVAYVTGIIRNQVRKHLRHNMEYQDIDEIANTFPDGRPFPLDEAIQEEAAILTSGLLNRLKAKEQKMLILRYIGYSHADIKLMLGIRSDGASRKFQKKALDRVRNLCCKLGIDAGQFSDGMRILHQEGKLDEMLNG